MIEIEEKFNKYFEEYKRLDTLKKQEELIRVLKKMVSTIDMNEKEKYEYIKEPAKNINQNTSQNTDINCGERNSKEQYEKAKREFKKNNIFYRITEEKIKEINDSPISSLEEKLNDLEEKTRWRTR